MSIKVLILKRDSLGITVKIGDKQFLVYQKFHYQCKMIYQYIFVLLSLIEDMLYWVYSTFSQKSKDLLFSNTFLHFLCKKICTVCIHFPLHVKNPQYCYSNSGFYHSIRNWPVHLFNILASYLNMTWMFWLHDLNVLASYSYLLWVSCIFHSFYCCTLNVYCTCLMWKLQ